MKKRRYTQVRNEIVTHIQIFASHLPLDKADVVRSKQNRYDPSKRRAQSPEGE